MLDEINMLNDSELEDVLGGVRGKPGGKTEKLPRHVCRDGKRGDLVENGFSGNGNGRFKCRLCGATGKINYLPGTRQLCDLI